MEKTRATSTNTTKDDSKKYLSTLEAMTPEQISAEAKQIVAKFADSMPKATQFLKKNWKPITTVAALSLGTFAIMKYRRSHTTDADPQTKH